MATLSSFEELACWQACRAFRRFVHSLVKRFPKEEAFLLTAQLKDSSRSTTHNIAEGFGRKNAMDNARFCRISSGSLHEAMDQLIACHDEHLITDKELLEGRELFTDARAWLEGYISYLGKAKGDDMLREPDILYGAHTMGSGSDHWMESTPNPPTPNPQLTNG